LFKPVFSFSAHSFAGPFLLVELTLNMLSKVRVRTRIYIAFGVIVALGVALAGFGVVQLSNVGAQQRIMVALAANVVRVGQAVENVDAIRRAETRIRLDGNLSALSEVKDLDARTDALLTAAAGAHLSTARVHTYESVEESLNAHALDLERYVVLKGTETADRTKLHSGGDQLAALTKKLIDAVPATAEPADRAAIADAYAAVLLVRIANLRFLATGDANGVATFKINFDKADAALQSCARIPSPEMKSLAGQARAALQNYAAFFSAVTTDNVNGIELYKTKLQPQLADIGKRLDEVNVSLTADFADASATAARIASSASSVQAILAGVGLLVGTALAAVIARGIAGPISAMTDAMTQLARGDVSVAIPARDNTDEIGEMARAVEIFRQQAMENTRLGDAAAQEHIAKDRRQKAMDAHTQDFGRSISGVMASLSESAIAMRSSVSLVTDSAQRTRATTSVTVESARTSAQDLNSVAAASEQLAQSVGEISRQVTHVTNAVQMAVARARETDAKVTSMSEAADRIGDVVRLIQTVASQTNLLALNATIEAARAGEAGKGFAVVAGEVKALATQTARATDQISSQIVSIRVATTEAVAAVREVGSAITQVEGVATAIAAAVEEQAAATRKITSNVQKLSSSTMAAAGAMDEVLSIAESTDASSVSALQVAEQVGRTAETLRREVTDFLSANSRGSDADRRRYERVSAGDAKAMLRIAGRPAIQVSISDISRGGISLVQICHDPIGTSVEVGLPGAGIVGGRVARVEGGVMGISLQQDELSLAQTDKALDFICDSGSKRAA